MLEQNTLYKVLCEETRNTTPDEDGADGSRATVMALEIHESMSDDALSEMVNSYWPAEHCQHEYDCCGRYYQSSPSIERSGRFAIITLSSYQNV